MSKFRVASQVSPELCSDMLKRCEADKRTLEADLVRADLKTRILLIGVAMLAAGYLMILMFLI